MRREIAYPGLRTHIRRFFKGHRRQEYTYTCGPADRIPTDFRVVRVAPGPRTELTTYFSVGAWEAVAEGDCATEFLVLTQMPEMKCIELLAMVAYYHRTEGLDVGHTFPLGHGWLSGKCDHFLVCLPYPFGPELELCDMGADGHVRFLWLLPITAEEKRFRHEHGLEALEQRFDEAKLNHSFPWRESVE